MSYTPLPYKKEFLLEMVNNNYSQETVKNYDRDLNFFSSFLWLDGISFTEFDKLAVSRYKGFLKQGDHLGAWLGLRKELLAAHEAKELRKMGFGLEELRSADIKTGQDPETLGTQGDPGESRASTPKIDYKKKEGLSPRSINRMLSSLRGYFKFLVDIDQEVPISADAIKLIKTEKKESQVAEFAELVMLIESPQEYETSPKIQLRNRALLELLFSTGMRISELVNIDREQLNLYNEMSNGIAGKLYIKGKGKKSRFVYLTERCKLWLDKYLETRADDYPALFIPYRGGRAGTKDPGTVRLSKNYIQDKIVQYRRKLGIVVPTSAHSLRHGFATYLAEEGASPAAIQRLLGHESLQTTTRYVHTSDRFAEKTHRDHHPLQEEAEIGD